MIKHTSNKTKSLEVTVEERKHQIEESLREYICIKCGHKMQTYSFGLGCDCRCTECGYKDGCCE